jgi:hypothetical protein
MARILTMWGWTMELSTRVSTAMSYAACLSMSGLDRTSCLKNLIAYRVSPTLPRFCAFVVVVDVDANVVVAVAAVVASPPRYKLLAKN